MLVRNYEIPEQLAGETRQPRVGVIAYTLDAGVVSADNEAEEIALEGLVHAGIAERTDAEPNANGGKQFTVTAPPAELDELEAVLDQFGGTLAELRAYALTLDPPVDLSGAKSRRAAITQLREHAAAAATTTEPED